MLAYVIRHAESRASAEDSTDLDSGLSALGEQQVLALARRFAALRLDAVYSSPFRRCLDTARPIASALGLPVRLRAELSEYHNFPAGTATAFPLPDAQTIVAHTVGAVICPDASGPPAWPALDEPFEALVARMQRFAGYLKSRWVADTDTVLVISHGSPIARLIEAWLTDRPGPSFRFVIDNAAVTALRFCRSVSSLVCLNEVSHLAELPPPELSNFGERQAVKPVPPGREWW